MIKSRFYKRFAPSPKSAKYLSRSLGRHIGDEKNLAVVYVEPSRFDIFGSLPRDIQIEVLGYVAADRPAQVLLMRKVCKRWHEILSEDSIYHSALFTASFTLPPPPVSLEAFQDVAWTDDRIRRFRLWKGRTIRYQRKAHPENNNFQPSKVIYRDGFIVWWVWDGHDQYFNYVDLNRTKKPKQSFSVRTTYSHYANFAAPLYTQAGGKLVYMRPKREFYGHGDCDRGRLNVVQLQSPLLRGKLSLSALESLDDGHYELYSSSDYALVLKGLGLLVADIKDIAAMKVLHVIELQEKISLESAVVNTIEINKDSCIVLLCSEVTGFLESLIFSLTSGTLLKRHSTKLERQNYSPNTIYQIRNDQFAKDTPYQYRNPTHKEHPPLGHGMRHHWVRVPTKRGGDECVAGTYEDTFDESSDTTIPRPLLQHRVTFAKQAVSFTALQDSFTERTVNRISLQIRTKGVGVEKQDSEITEQPRAAPGGSPAKANWSHSARMTAPKDCLRQDGDSISTDTHQWALQRAGWGPHSILLGDEKALVLALPHQLVVWRFETLQMWKDRKKRRIKRLALKTLVHGMLLPAYAGIGVVMLPVLCLAGVGYVCVCCKRLKTPVESDEL